MASAKPQTKRREYHDPCECGACPWPWRKDRPGTLAEFEAYVRHRFPWLPKGEQHVHATGCFTSNYKEWRLRGWRKPPNWADGPVPLRKVLPKDPSVNRQRFFEWRQRLIDQKGGEDS